MKKCFICQQVKSATHKVWLFKQVPDKHKSHFRGTLIENEKCLAIYLKPDITHTYDNASEFTEYVNRYLQNGFKIVPPKELEDLIENINID